MPDTIGEMPFDAAAVDAEGVAHFRNAGMLRHMGVEVGDHALCERIVRIYPARRGSFFDVRRHDSYIARTDGFAGHQFFKQRRAFVSDACAVMADRRNGNDIVFADERIVVHAEYRHVFGHAQPRLKRGGFDFGRVVVAVCEYGDRLGDGCKLFPYVGAESGPVVRRGAEPVELRHDGHYFVAGFPAPAVGEAVKPQLLEPVEPG